MAKTTRQITDEFHLRIMEEAVEALEGVDFNIAFYGPDKCAIDDVLAALTRKIDNIYDTDYKALVNAA